MLTTSNCLIYAFVWAGHGYLDLLQMTWLYLVVEYQSFVECISITLYQSCATFLSFTIPLCTKILSQHTFRRLRMQSFHFNSFTDININTFSADLIINCQITLSTMSFSSFSYFFGLTNTRDSRELIFMEFSRSLEAIIQYYNGFGLYFSSSTLSSYLIIRKFFYLIRDWMQKMYFSLNYINNNIISGNFIFTGISTLRKIYEYNSC